MVRKYHALTNAVVRNAESKHPKAPTLLSDGGGLYLQITPTGVKSWIFRYTIDGRTRSMGLGPLGAMTLDEARRRVRELLVMVDRGIDPIDARNAEREARRQARIAQNPPKPTRKLTDFERKTFRWCADSYIAQLRETHRNEKHTAQWRSTLEQYAHTLIGDKSVDDITTPDILRIIEPLFKRIPTTAQRLQQRIEKVLAWCIVRGHRTSQENPVRWKSHLSEAIPAAHRKVIQKHHNALAYQEMPAFMELVQRDDTDGSLLLQFMIFTWCRTGEARGATWAEISPDLSTWTIPAERMKGAVEHRVPLSAAAQFILKHQREKNDHMLVPSCYVFPGRKAGQSISSAAAIEFLKRIDRTDCTPHGMRACARMWAAECTDFPREVCEHALAHKLRDRVEAAYQRADYFEKRRKLMDAWEAYCLSGSYQSETPSSAS